MKELYWILALAVASASCQQQAPPTRAGVGNKVEAIANQASVAPVKAMQLPAAATAPADMLTPEMTALLRTYNLAPLWNSNYQANAHSDDSNNSPVVQGFFGPDHYRIALAFTQVRQDSLNPALFQVKGKSQYKKIVTPFSGTLEIKRLANLHTFLDVAPEDSAAQAYTAEAWFNFREDAAAKGAGVFAGTALLDFYITPKGVIGQVVTMNQEGNPARGQGLIFKGQWNSNQTKEQKKLLLARDVFRIAPDVLQNFGIGERSGEINPKYAKLGWNEYWENDEWWADSPTAQL